MGSWCAVNMGSLPTLEQRQTILFHLASTLLWQVRMMEFHYHPIYKLSVNWFYLATLNPKLVQESPTISFMKKASMQQAQSRELRAVIAGGDYVVKAVAARRKESPVTVAALVLVTAVIKDGKCE